MSFTDGKVVRVSLRATRGGDQQVNTLHYDLVDTAFAGPNDPQSLADAFRDAVLGPFKALYHSDWTIEPVEVVEERDPQHPDSPRSGWQSGTAGAGTKADPGDLLPQQCCVIASLPTDRIGRRARGRLFVGGTWGEVDQSNGNWSNTAKALVQSFLDAIPHQPDISPPTATSTANWSVYSRTARAQGLDPYMFHVGSPIVRAPVHWLRSRTP